MISSPGDSGVYHKCTNAVFDGMEALPGLLMIATKEEKYRLVVKEGMGQEWRQGLDVLQQRLLHFADSMVRRLSAFHTVMGGRRSDFAWGSNAVAANQGMLLLNAWLLKRDKKYLNAALDNLDYLLGRNTIPSLMRSWLILIMIALMLRMRSPLTGMRRWFTWRGVSRWFLPLRGECHQIIENSQLANSSIE